MDTEIYFYYASVLNQSIDASAHSLDSLSRYVLGGRARISKLHDPRYDNRELGNSYFCSLLMWEPSGNGKIGGLILTVLWNDVDNLVGRPQSPIEQTGPLSPFTR